MTENKVSRKGPSKMAERIALIRAGESRKPENERICYDPYAIRFISPVMLEFISKYPDLFRAAGEQFERFIPGANNSIIARVRYFDDFIKDSIKEGLDQLVILGAGYDTRAYRIEELKNLKVFEVDHQDTLDFKIKKVKEIFNLLPEHVVYVPIDFETETLDQKLLDGEYDPSKKTLFIMEGLVYYIPPESVDETISFIVNNSGDESAVLFDYYPESVIDGTSKLEVGRNTKAHAEELGEPLQFGIEDGKIENFLKQRGFSKIKDITSEDYKKAYFHGKNENSEVCSIYSFVYAFKD